MQLHPGSFNWTSNDHSSDLSIQWSQLTRPYSSTDRSSSLGSMESLDTPTPSTQPYSDSRNSPIDAATINSKRDSAYSSFSASSNTSDYATVPLRPEETCSMENLLHTLGPAGETSNQSHSAAPEEVQLKSRSLTRPRPRPVEVRERPSSCCYEVERRGENIKMGRNGEEGGSQDGRTNPPQPPTRKDSFRATRGRLIPDGQSCASAASEASDVSSHSDGNLSTLTVESETQNGFSEHEDKNQTVKEEGDGHFFPNQTAEMRQVKCDAGSVPESSSAVPFVKVPVRTKHSSASPQRHSAPEKLLIMQLQFLHLESNGSSLEAPKPADLQNSNSQLSSSSSHHTAGEDQEGPHHHVNAAMNKHDETPGFMLFGDHGVLSDGAKGSSVNGGSVQNYNHWGRSNSVPDDHDGPSTQEHKIFKQMLQEDFQPLGSAASVDTLLEEQRAADRGGRTEEGSEGETALRNSNTSRHNRRNRRRSDRFATNLRNEIQKKKSQLQRSRGPGELLCSGETVQEEEGPDLSEHHTKSDVAKNQNRTGVPAPPVEIQDVRLTSTLENPNRLSGSFQTHSMFSTSRNVLMLDTGVPGPGLGVRVVEEPAPAGKARRWRWTPEHKLQPEQEADRRGRMLGDKTSGLTRPSSSRSSSCPPVEEYDILPFADRMRFFEETSRITCGPSVPGLSGHPQKKPGHRPEQSELCVQPTQRRLSFQENLVHPNTLETRRPFPSTSRRQHDSREQEWELQDKKIEMEQERIREREREERLRQWERERERELEMEQIREKERLQIKRENELRELERIREMERLQREREIELEMEKIREMREMERLRREQEKELQRDEAGARLRSHQEFLYNPESHQGFQHLHNFQVFPHVQSLGQVPPSAFYPFSSSSKILENQGYTPRCLDPTQTSASSRKQETSKINRKYSLTERDYMSWRRGSRPPDDHHYVQQRSCYSTGVGTEQGERGRSSFTPLGLRGRAMSENDLWGGLSVSLKTNQTLSEVDEMAGSAKPSGKKAPPPRPPPPKWEEFHRRRASHHALLTGSSSTYVPPLLEPSRQRSFSLPPERKDVTQSCPHCSYSQSHPQENPASNPSRAVTLAPLSPMFSRRSFRPVAPPHREGEEHQRSLYRQGHGVVEAGLQSDSSSFPGVYIDPSSDPSSAPRVHREIGLPAPEGVRGATSPESYFSMDNEQQQKQIQNHSLEAGTESETTMSPSPAHSVETDLDVPLETDIDDFQEEELPVQAEPITSELPCLALPVTVLETDMDTVPDRESSPQSRAQAESGSVNGQLQTEEVSREQQSSEQIFSQNSEGESGAEMWRGAVQTMDNSTDSLESRSRASSSCSSYYSTSAAKAQLLSQLKDYAEDRERNEVRQENEDNDDELNYKKQLMESLRKKLGVLREAQRGLQEDIRANALLGDQVEQMVVSVCRPQEVDKFRMFMGDLDKVVSLLLSLSGRLLRVDTALESLEQEEQEHHRLSLLEKKRQLMHQLSEAQELKDHVDSREQAVSRVLAQSLSPEQHRDYIHFVKMKAALLVEQRQLDDKIRLGEEQLRALRESLGLGLGSGLGMSLVYGQY
ncbi:protein Shroom4 isoform X4 [Cynoglossus semilaevis]|nr:protein Shroom4 isoform X4 [Cynoglossus semilaevis]